MKPVCKSFVMLSPISIAAGATSETTVDTRGFSYARITLLANTSTATTKPVELNLAECSTSNGTFADITKFVGTTGTAVTTASGFVIPLAVTAGTWAVAFEVDLKGRERFLQLSVSPGTTAIYSAICELFKATEMPVGVTELGLNAVAQG